MDLTDWQQFVDLLFQLSKVERKGKRDAQLMSPAIYKPDTTRANVNVDSWAGWACLLYTSPSPRDRQKSRMPSSA